MSELARHERRGDFMTPALTSTALALHDLGLAAGFGGSLFGKFALNPTVSSISSAEERGEVVNAAWNGYNVINALALGTTALTWIIGRSAISGREFGPDVRRWVVAKDVFLGTTLATGCYNLIAGAFLLKKQKSEGVPMRTGSTPAPEASEDAKFAQKSVNYLGIVNLCAMAGVIVTTAVLNNKAGASHRWSFLSKYLLP
jgi:hypothetical protein